MRPEVGLDSAQHKARLRHYFDGIGFERWSAIYGGGSLSPVRRSIREGHTAMLAVADKWLADRWPSAAGLHALDAGCGTGLFSLILARRGFQVSAADLAPQMAAATEAALAAAGFADQANCWASDLEEVSGSYDLVACFDVLIHYAPAPFAPMLTHLASMARDTILFTYAPYSPLLAALHRIGGIFPHSQRRTEIQMIPDELVRRTLTTAGMRIRRTQRVSKSFYHVTLVEATRGK